MYLRYNTEFGNLRIVGANEIGAAALAELYPDSIFFEAELMVPSEPKRAIPKFRICHKIDNRSNTEVYDNSVEAYNRLKWMKFALETGLKDATIENDDDPNTIVSFDVIEKEVRDTVESFFNSLEV